MKVNLLDTFKANVLRLKFDPKNKDSYVFDSSQVDFTLKVLKDFFSESKFIVHQNLSQVEHSGLKARFNWLEYQLSQYSVGSVLLVMEISAIIHYFSNRPADIELLTNKLKTKNGRINDRELRMTIFELHTAIILEKAGLKINIDDHISPNKPLDISINTNSEKIIVECKTINETQLEDQIIDISSYCIASYTKLIEQNKSNFKLLQYLPVTLYMVLKDHSKAKKAKILFKETLLKYQNDIGLVAKGEKEINVPYHLSDEEVCSIIIEPYKPGLYETYTGFFGENTGFRFRLFPRSTHNGSYFVNNLEFIYTPKSLENRIKKSIEEKQEQHKDTDTRKVYFLEYENYVGFRVPFRFDEKSFSRIKGKLKPNEITCLIHKDSTKNNLTRRMLVISNNENDPLVKVLKNVDLNPFIKLK